MRKKILVVEDDRDLADLLRYNLEKKIFKKADKIIAVSREDKSFMEDRYGLDNVIYLTNGIESPAAAILNQSREELREDLNLPLDWFLFVTVARFNFQKGYDILIRSLALLKNFLAGKKVKFVLIGKGAEFSYIKKLAEKLSVSSYVSFLGERFQFNHQRQNFDYSTLILD